MDMSTSTRLSTTVDGLPDIVGQEFGPSSWRTISQQEVQQYADLSGDHNPIHTDPEAAAASPFGTTIVHGYLTLGLVVPLLAEIFEVTEVGTGINYGLDRLRFPSPVPVGSRVRVTGVVSAVTPVSGGHQVSVTVTFELEGSAKPAVVAEMVLRYYK